MHSTDISVSAESFQHIFFLRKQGRGWCMYVDEVDILHHMLRYTETKIPTVNTLHALTESRREK